MSLKFFKNLVALLTALLAVASPSLALGPNDSLDPSSARVFSWRENGYFVLT
jgi:hypothetical protein